MAWVYRVYPPNGSLNKKHDLVTNGFRSTLFFECEPRHWIWENHFLQNEEPTSFRWLSMAFDVFFPKIFAYPGPSFHSPFAELRRFTEPVWTEPFGS